MPPLDRAWYTLTSSGGGGGFASDPPPHGSPYLGEPPPPPPPPSPTLSTTYTRSPGPLPPQPGSPPHRWEIFPTPAHGSRYRVPFPLGPPGGELGMFHGELERVPVKSWGVSETTWAVFQKAAIRVPPKTSPSFSRGSFTGSREAAAERGGAARSSRFPLWVWVLAGSTVDRVWLKMGLRGPDGPGSPARFSGRAADPWVRSC
jgi:hypothetical protein